jgi:4-amino-4-deoxy-L-arabinose transferase-like glycosyltransferase
MGVVGRLVLAAVLGLGVDESYEVVMSRVLSLGYFDHPPLSFWIPGLLSLAGGSENRVLLRLPFVVLFAGTTILLYRLTARLYGDRAGFIAALLLNISPVFSVSTGGWILPDGPLDCAMVGTALCLTRALITGGNAWRWWLGAGACAGVALLAKYHGVFALLGALVFVFTRRESRQWLRRPEPYVATLLALAISSPVLIWNAAHHFVSFRFQVGRASSHGVHVTSLAQNVAGQIGYLLPWIWVPLVWQLVRGLRVGPSDASRWLLICLAIGPIVVFTSLSLGGNPGLPHWPAPGYLLLFPLVGAELARYETSGARERTRTRRGLTSAVAVFVLLIAIAASDVATGWAARVAPSLFARGDPSLEAVDWSDLGPELRARGLLGDGNAVVATTHWIDASKVGYALGRAHPVLCLSDDPRGFQFTYSPNEYSGRDVLLLVRTRRGARPDDVLDRVGGYFELIVPADTVPIVRAGRVEFNVAAFRGYGLRVRP